MSVLITDNHLISKDLKFFENIDLEKFKLLVATHLCSEILQILLIR